MQAHLQVSEERKNASQIFSFMDIVFPFRYYNTDGSNKMSFSEFCDLVRDVREAKGYSTSKADVEKEATMSAK